MATLFKRSKNVLRKIGSALISERELARPVLRVLAIVFLAAAALIGLKEYSVANGWLPDATITYQPTFKSGLLAFALMLPLYARRILRWEGFSLFSIITSILSLAFVSSLLEMFLGGETSPLFGWLQLPNISFILLAVTIACLWLGIRAVAGVFAGLFLLFAAINIASASLMGLWGFAFLVFGVFGILLQQRLSPGRFFRSISSEWRGPAEISTNEQATKALERPEDTTSLPPERRHEEHRHEESRHEEHG